MTLASEPDRRRTGVHSTHRARRITLGRGSGPVTVAGPYQLGSAAPKSSKAFRYDGLGRVIAVGRSLSGASIIDVTAATEYVPAQFVEDGVAADTPGAVRQFAFSAAVTLTAGQAPPTGPDVRISTAHLDALGRTLQVRERLGTTNGTASPSSQIQQYATGYRVASAVRYDEVGRVTGTLEPFFAYSDAYEPFEALASASGRRGSVARFDARGWPSCSASGVFVEADLAGRCTSAFEASSSTLSFTKYAYASPQHGLIAVEVLPPSSTPINGTKAVYAASGLLRWTTDAFGNEIRRGYDLNGRLTSITRIGIGGVGEQTYSKQYDSLGRVVTETDPNWSPGKTPSRRYWYDAQSRLQTVFLAPQPVGTTSERAEIHYEYGSLGRRTRVYVREPVAAGTGVTFQERDLALIRWDAPYNGDTAKYPYTVGAMSWVSSDKTTIALGYDRDGNVARRDQWFVGISGAFTATSQWGNDGRLLSTSFASPYSKTVTMTSGFDTAARPVRIGVGTTALWEAVQVSSQYGAYDAYGRLTQVKSNGGTVTTSRTYDPVTQDLTAHSVVVTATQAQVFGIDRIVYFGTKLQSFSDTTSGTDYDYRYDANARVERATAKPTGSSTLAQNYDEGYSFTDEAWTPDATVGNLEAVTSYGNNGSNATTSYAYADDRVTALSGGTAASLTYDHSGRVEQESRGSVTTRYAYDVEGRLLSVTRNNVIDDQLAYDPMGALMWRRAGTEVSYFVGETATVTATVPSSCTSYGCSVDSGSVKVAVHASLGGARIATVRAPATSSTASVDSDVLYYHRDRQGSVIATTLTGGAVGYRYRYTPYGAEERAEPPPLALPSAVDGRSHFGYTGGLKLSGNLLHLNARVYDARLMRFLQADLIDLLRYGYANGDPANRVDPSGRMPIEFGQRYGGVTWQPAWGTTSWYNVGWAARNVTNRITKQRLIEHMATFGAVSPAEARVLAAEVVKAYGGVWPQEDEGSAPAGVQGFLRCIIIESEIRYELFVGEIEKSGTIGPARTQPYGYVKATVGMVELAAVSLSVVVDSHGQVFAGVNLGGGVSATGVSGSLVTGIPVTAKGERAQLSAAESEALHAGFSVDAGSGAFAQTNHSVSFEPVTLDEDGNFGGPSARYTPEVGVGVPQASATLGIAVRVWPFGTRNSLEWTP